VTIIIFAISCSVEKRNNINDNPLLITSKAIDTIFTDDSLRIKTDSTIWIYIINSKYSYLSHVMSGNTNAKSIGVETYGDRIIGLQELNLDSSNHFNDTV